MKDRVGAWLESVGLGEHAQSFAGNDIEFDLLARLSSEDLKELGLSVGHRRRFLDAVVTLADLTPHPTGNVEPAASEAAERRQLTVMFCDLVGSTALSGRLDPEDLHALNRSYQDACKTAIERYAGFVARYMGDGVLAYFGYPEAHEDDAERAILAGLAAVDAVREIGRTSGQEPGVELATRVSIATGAVVVGDLIGDGASRESPVVGDTPNLAARLQELANAHEVVVASGTHALARGQFVYEHLGSHELKGFTQPVQAWRVLASAETASRFEARHSSALTPLVGREHEIGLLLERWEQAREGDGQIVFLSGEAGIGKSRISEALRERTALDDPIRLRYQCSSYHTDSALHPIIAQLSRAALLESSDSPGARLDRLEGLLAGPAEDVESAVPLLASLLSIPPRDQPELPEMTPEQHKEATLEALVGQMESLARARPLLILFEDVHWADATSLELLGRMVERARDIPILIVVTSRVEYAPPWISHSHVTPITLKRLSRRLALEMVDEVTAGKPLPAEVRDQIIEKTDGVPLFVEELTRTVIESELLVDLGDRYTLIAPLRPLAIPSTLHDSLMARLDRLAPVREIAQLAAVIGRDFSRDVLVAVSPLAPDALDDALRQLTEAALLFRRGTPPRVHYVFKHALVQDAAYESLLKSKRRELHGRIAGVLAERFPETANNEPELLAHHYTEAGITDTALDYWLAAGRRAAEQAAYQEAVAHLRHGLTLIEDLPQERQARREVTLRVALGVPLMNREDVGSREVGENYRRARALCDEVGADEERFPVLWGLWYHHMLRFEVRRASQLADELMTVGQGQNDRSLRLEAHHCQWASRFLLGELEATLEHADQGLRLYRSEEHHALTFLYGGHDPGVCAYDVGAITLWLSGYPEQAHARLEKALALARELGQPSTLANTTAKALTVAGLRRDQDAMIRLGERLLQFVPMERAEQLHAHADGALGWVRYQRGEHEPGLALMRESARSGLMEDPWHIYLTSMIATTLAGHGAVREGLALVEEALQLGDKNQVHWWDPELYRVKGELLRIMETEDAAGIEACFERAMEIARSRNARSLELRAAVSLARSRAQRGLRSEARELLLPQVEWFTEGLDTVDLKEARAVLDSLS